MASTAPATVPGRRGAAKQRPFLVAALSGAVGALLYYSACRPALAALAARSQRRSRSAKAMSAPADVLHRGDEVSERLPGPNKRGGGGKVNVGNGARKGPEPAPVASSPS